MNRPTLSTLPEDVLEEISGEMEAGLTWSDDQIKVFPPLTLLCRSLLPVSRRYLLAEPLAGKCTWNVATKLVSTLKAHGGSSARAVRSLEELTSWMSYLQNLEAPTNLSFQIRGQTEAFSWGVAMLNACPSLKKASDQDCAYDAGAVRLKTVHTFVNKLAIESLDTLEVVSAKDENLLTSTCLPLRLKELAVYGNTLSFDSAPTFLPSNPSSLCSLDIHSQHFRPASLLDLVKLVGPTLTSLSLSPPAPYYLARYSQYGRPYSGPVIPLEVFSLLPIIKHLSLSGSRALSVARIRALSNSSPHLVSLHAEESIWVPDAGIDTTTPGWQKRIFPQVKLANLFKASFANLESLDVGFVPVREYDEIRTLQEAMDRKGVTLEWRGCEERCPMCGGYH